MSRAPAHRTRRSGASIAKTVRISEREERQIERLRESLGTASEQPVLLAALRTGLQEQLLRRTVELQRSGYTVAQAAAEVGLPVEQVFDHFVAERVTLVEDPAFLEHVAELGELFELPELIENARRLAAERSDAVGRA